MRILIADDHPLVRQGLVELVRGQHPDWECIEAGSFDQVLRSCAESKVDLASIDLMMPGVSGPGALADLRRMHPDLKLVVLTDASERSLMLDCLAVGVRGYMLKSSAGQHLLRAIELVLDGGVYFPSALAGAWPAPGQMMVSHTSSPMPSPSIRLAPTAALTGRQRQVLGLLVEGCSTKDIARRLNLGIGTVKVHLAGVYKTLGARNRMEAVMKAARAAQP